MRKHWAFMLVFYRVAVNDFLKRPSVHRINGSRYNGNTAQLIPVTATDNFRLVDVTVQIVDPTGVEIGKGVCAYHLPTARFVYTTTVSVPDLTGVTIIATATDVPGHTGELAITL